MPLQIRRGTTAQRLTVTPLPGELIYDTTTGQIFVGDGTTVGGAVTTGVSLEDARDAAAALFTNGVHSGITFTYNDTLDRIDATVTIGGVGPFDGDINGSVFADNSSILVDAVDGQIKGSLNTSGVLQTITSTALTGNVGLLITGSVGSYVLVDENRLKVRIPPSTSTDNGISVELVDNSPLGPRYCFNKARGTVDVPTAVVNNDSLGDFFWSSHDGGNYALAGRFGMVAEGTPVASSGLVPAKFRFQTATTSSFSTKAEISSTGILKIDSIQNFTGSSLGLTATSIDAFGNVVMKTNSAIRFEDNDGSAYVSLKAPPFLAGNVTLNLPSTSGSNLNVLYTDGSGNLIFGSLATVFPGQIGTKVSIGTNAGSTNQGNNGIALGESAGQTNQGLSSIALGYQAGQTNQGTYAVAVGYRAGYTSQHNNSVVINGGSGTLNSTASGTFINPIRGRAPNGVTLGYDTTTKEVFYQNVITTTAVISDFYGSVFGNDSTMIVDAIDSNVTGRTITSTRCFQSPVYVDEVSRNAAIPSPSRGMLAFVTNSDDGVPTLCINTDSTLPGWENVVTFDRLLGGIPSILPRDIKGSVFTDTSTQVIDGQTGAVNTPSVDAGQVTASTFFQLPIYADDTARLAAIPSPSKGMMIFMESGTAPAATNVAQVFDGTNWINL